MSVARTTFSITGAPQKAATLHVAGPLASNEETPLFMAAPPEAVGTLIIGRDQFASGDASLVILGDIISDDGNESTQATIPVFVKGTSGTGFDTTFGLVLKSQPFASGVGEATLYLRQDNFIPDENNDASLFVSGDITSAGGNVNNAATLQIENREGESQTFTLYIDKDFNNSSETSLFVKSLSANNNITAAVSGAFRNTGDTTLMIKPPTSGNLNLFTRGYLE
tara:strand:+ start:1369 stop:2040 length:672 start_codon:yes stop_codon:yes gene_type:complete